MPHGITNEQVLDKNMEKRTSGEEKIERSPMRSILKWNLKKKEKKCVWYRENEESICIETVE